MINEGTILLSMIVILMLVIWCYVATLEGGFLEKLFWGGLGGLCGSLIGTLAIFSSFAFFDSEVIDTYYKPTVYIHSLKNSNDVYGSFSLGCGTVENVEYYYYYYKSDGGFKRGKSPVATTLIVEDNSISPRKEIKIEHHISKTGLINYVDREIEEYRIIVPKGTVINKFEVY